MRNGVADFSFDFWKFCSDAKPVGFMLSAREATRLQPLAQDP
jgi:hypothetical protein